MHWPSWTLELLFSRHTHTRRRLSGEIAKEHRSNTARGTNSAMNVTGATSDKAVNIEDSDFEATDGGARGKGRQKG